MEMLSTLGINWQLLLAQVVNFGIILFVLTKFLYRPILKAVDDRREATRKAMEEVDRIENQKKEMDQIRLEQMRKLDEEAGQIMEKAKQNAEKLGNDLLEKARSEADQIVERARKQLESERQEALANLQETLAGVIIRLTEKILEREFAPADQKRLVTNLQKELPNLLQ